MESESVHRVVREVVKIRPPTLITMKSGEVLLLPPSALFARFESCLLLRELMDQSAVDQYWLPNHFDQEVAGGDIAEAWL